MKVLITGATGFVGSHLLPELVENGNQCCCLIRKESDLENLKPIRNHLEYFEGDITQKNTLAGICKGVDIVIHLAFFITSRYTIQNRVKFIVSLLEIKTIPTGKVKGC